MTKPTPQIAGRGIVVRDQKLLMVNGDGDGSYWCTPGGRLEYGETIEGCVKREVYEETGLSISVGDLFAVNQFHRQDIDFHLVQMFFRTEIEDGELRDDWVDVGGPVHSSRFFSLEELHALPKIYPDFLLDGHWVKESGNPGFYPGMVVIEKVA